MIDMVVFYIKIEMETKYKKIIDLLPFRNILFAYSKPATVQRQNYLPLIKKCCRTNYLVRQPRFERTLSLFYTLSPRYLLIA